MKRKKITHAEMEAFKEHLNKEEKSPATIEKYLRDVRSFAAFLGKRKLSKEEVICYKQLLLKQQYAVTSVNSMLAAVNSFVTFLGYSQFKVKQLKTQRRVYSSEEMELTKEEYLRLIREAKKKKSERLSILIQTICSTGIRVSELSYFHVEAVQKGEIMVSCKNKNRIILIPQPLKKLLLDYAQSIGIKTGPIFITKNGRPIDRSNIWAEMKALCEAANVSTKKVFPHNLRKLFARSFYDIDKDIAKLADILGHSNINTTRIYIISTGKEHRERLEKLDLVK